MSGRVFLGNAFSLGMLELPRGVGVSLCVEELDLERWVERVRFHRLVSGELECVIGHDSTARLAEMLLNMAPWVGEGELRLRLSCKRRMIRLRPGDALYVVQLKFRPEEGRVYDYGELVRLLREDRIGFYAVYYGPC